MRDGSTTYHFFESPQDSANQQSQAGAGQAQPALNSNSVVSFEASPAIAAYLADRQLQSKPQQRDGASSWSRQLAQLQRGNAHTKYKQQREAYPRQRRSSTSSGPASQVSNGSSTAYNGNGNRNGNGSGASGSSTSLDTELDFDESSTELLLRAYSSRAAAGRLDAALHVLQGVIKAGRIDVLKRSVHVHCWLSNLFTDVCATRAFKPLH